MLKIKRVKVRWNGIYLKGQQSIFLGSRSGGIRYNMHFYAFGN